MCGLASVVALAIRGVWGSVVSAAGAAGAAASGGTSRGRAAVVAAFGGAGAGAFLLNVSLIAEGVGRM